MIKTLSAAVLTLALTGFGFSTAGHAQASPPMLTDAQINAAVKASLDNYPDLQNMPSNISVQTIDHVVYLYGMTETAFQGQTAGMIARAVPGVAHVVNTISEQSR